MNQPLPFLYLVVGSESHHYILISGRFMNFSYIGKYQVFKNTVQATNPGFKNTSCESAVSEHRFRPIPTYRPFEKVGCTQLSRSRIWTVFREIGPSGAFAKPFREYGCSRNIPAFTSEFRKPIRSFSRKFLNRNFLEWRRTGHTPVNSGSL